MILVTLESLPYGSTVVAKSIHTSGTVSTTPPPPIPTGHDEELSSILCHIANMFKSMCRSGATTTVFCGSHFLAMPARCNAVHRLIIHDLVKDLARELALAYGIQIHCHVLIFLTLDVDESFHSVITQLDTRDIHVYDLEDTRDFLLAIARGDRIASPFPTEIETVNVPRFVADNTSDNAATTAQVLDIIKKYELRRDSIVQGHVVGTEDFGSFEFGYVEDDLWRGQSTVPDAEVYGSIGAFP